MGLEGFGFGILVVIDVLLVEDGGCGGGGGGGVGVVDIITSTGFLERFLPLCMCLSQYLESG